MTSLKKTGRLPSPPPKNAPTISNLTKREETEFVTLNLRVSAEYRRTLKIYAAEHDMNMVSVIKKAVEMYMEKYK